MPSPFPRLARRRDVANLQAVAGKAVVGRRLSRIVERRFVVPAGQEVQPVGVVHRVKPDAHGVAQILDVAAGENASRQIPVVGLAVDRHFGGRRQNGDAQILCLRTRERRTRPTESRPETERRI